ncbi:MAG: glycoside hydrolase, partial [Anaerolineaceae bacterium]|nr:glycoside hydrolase [Anaerolineaceae bacterium]
MNDLGFCVHGHFYQPSREDPITGEIPEERGAFPYKNWNELIFSHCYLPNTELENFRKISFNFGPTLLNWMEKKYPEVYTRIISQERENFEKFGVGNALAQPYHHTILPLASKEDKITQIQWGIEDYKHRFGHQPAGAWLPETAVDMESLEILVDFGIQFTILAPWQADTENLDITQPYWVKLTDQKRIAVFFYHQDLSTQISFNPLTTINADVFASNFVLPNLIQNGDHKRPKYLLLASDGELYGHHQPFRDKFLAHLLNGSIKNKNISQIYPGLWLKENPPREYIKIKEKTSWSCHHGVNRWSTGCDCTPHSDWKNYLRIFIDRVSEIVNDVYQSELSTYTSDVW